MTYILIMVLVLSFILLINMSLNETNLPPKPYNFVNLPLQSKIFSLSNIKKHFTLINFILGIISVILISIIKYSGIIYFILTPFNEYSHIEIGEYLILGFTALIVRLGIKGSVEEIINIYIFPFINYMPLPLTNVEENFHSTYGTNKINNENISFSSTPTDKSTVDTYNSNPNTEITNLNTTGWNSETFVENSNISNSNIETSRFIPLSYPTSMPEDLTSGFIIPTYNQFIPVTSRIENVSEYNITSEDFSYINESNINNNNQVIASSSKILDTTQPFNSLNNSTFFKTPETIIDFTVNKDYLVPEYLVLRPKFVDGAAYRYINTKEGTTYSPKTWAVWGKITQKGTMAWIHQDAKGKTVAYPIFDRPLIEIQERLWPPKASDIKKF